MNIVREGLEFYPQLLERNDEQENEQAFKDNVGSFNALHKMVSKENGLVELRSLVNEKKQQIIELQGNLRNIFWRSRTDGMLLF